MRIGQRDFGLHASKRGVSMRTITLTAVLTASLFTNAVPAAPQSGNLVQQVQSTYVPNALDASGIKVAQPGVILAVQVDGIQGAPRGKLSQPFANVYESGQIKRSEERRSGKESGT